MPDVQRSIGTLKLPKEDAEKFLAALNGYGFEKSAIFLRRCAIALIKHHGRQDELAQPLAFKVVPQEKQTKESGIVRLSGKSVRKQVASGNH